MKYNIKLIPYFWNGIMSTCYYPGCESHANTKEHITPKSFFPDSSRDNLMTVKSCRKHNNEKTKDDIYALANICINSIADSSAIEVFESSVKPQLMHNNKALLRKIIGNPIKNEVSHQFQIDITRLNSFFDCLTYGVVYKKLKKRVDLESYQTKHIYMNLSYGSDKNNIEERMKEYWQQNIFQGEALQFLELKLGKIKGYSEGIYNVKFLGADFTKADEDIALNSSITVVHEFYGHFKVISLLTRVANFEKSLIHIKPFTS